MSDVDRNDGEPSIDDLSDDSVVTDSVWSVAGAVGGEGFAARAWISGIACGLEIRVDSPGDDAVQLAGVIDEIGGILEPPGHYHY